jgi:hypothetical protein
VLFCGLLDLGQGLLHALLELTGELRYAAEGDLGEAEGEA